MKGTISTNAQVTTARKIKKVKLTKVKTLELTFEETTTIIKDEDGVEKITSMSADYTRIGKNIVHQDMIDALNLLRSHLAILCDQVEAQDKNYYQLEEDEEALNKYRVNSYSIGGSDIHEGVTLSGIRYSRSGAPLNLNSPFTKWEGGDNEDTYENSFELRGMINHCNEEALLYIDGKMAPDAQLDLFDQPDENQENLDDPNF